MGAPDTTNLMNRTNTEGESSAILAAGELIERYRATPKTPAVLHAPPFVILKDKDGNERVEWLKEQFINPTFRRGVVKLDDARSFIEYFNTHANPASAVYAKQNPAKFIAVLDEHPGEASSHKSAAWRQFRAEFAPTHAPEWDTWTRFNKQPFESTEKFAYFLEENLPDIVEPSGSELMDVALNFRVQQNVAYSAVQRLDDGHAEISFVNQVEGTSSGTAGKMRIPEKFRLEIPVFAGIGTKVYSVDARFRYRLASNSGLKLWYELVRPHKVLERAFTELWGEVGAGVKRPILLGLSD